MNNLVVIKDGQAVVSSRQIAENFEKEHRNVLQAIRNIISSAENSAQYFFETSYKDKSGKSNVEYLMNRDGFSLLVMGFTGEKALEWKIKYINEFNRMEQELQKAKLPPPQSPDIAKTLRAEAMLNNSLAKKAKELRALLETTKVQKHKDVLVVYSANMLARKDILELPAVEKSFTATQVGEMLKISANKVGKVANKLELKAEEGSENEYGYWAADIAKHGNKKQVESWRYYKEGIDAIREYLQEQPTQ